MGLWSSQVLQSAVELGVFAELGKGPRSLQQLRNVLDLSERAAPDFLDSLVALGFLEREGDDAHAIYINTRESAHFLDPRSGAYIGATLHKADGDSHAGRLSTVLRTGRPQQEAMQGAPQLATPCEDPARLGQYLESMGALSTANFQVFAERFDFHGTRTLADIGGGAGELVRVVAARHEQMSCVTLDLPPITAIAERRIHSDDLFPRVRAQPIDFLTEPFPRADVITLSMVLRRWNLRTKRLLIAKAYQALPHGGCLVAIENLIDDARRKNTFALLMSVMLIECGEGFDFTGADFDRWCREAGFASTRLIALAGPASAAIAYK
jgi:hypothetical protein